MSVVQEDHEVDLDVDFIGLKHTCFMQIANGISLNLQY